MPRYRLALDLGTTSLGWAVLRINQDNLPTAIIKAGVRIFSDGRKSKGGRSLAVTRRMARAMRRRRDRLLKRKARMKKLLQHHGFFPNDPGACKDLEVLNPFEIRARGLDEPLSAEEFGRAIFHLNQRRGFKSNRKTDGGDSDDGLLKSSISELRQQLDPTGQDGKARTVGEFLWRRLSAGEPVRARYRERRVTDETGKSKLEKSYDLYFDRAMVAAEFDALWGRQASFHPDLFTDQAKEDLKDCLLFQRNLKPMDPGRCTFEPDCKRVRLALPSQQLFRIFQDVNHLRLLCKDLEPYPLTIEQRDQVVDALVCRRKMTFSQIRRLLGLDSTATFSIEDERRQDLSGDQTSATLCKKDLFGPAWLELPLDTQDSIVTRLLETESEAELIDWLQTEHQLTESQARKLARVRLPDGYGRLSQKAIRKIVPELRAEVVTYDKAVKAAGYGHHSALSHLHQIGEVLTELPYYGEYLQRHVGFGTGDSNDVPEKRFGKIANPTVHIGLNQTRKVVNALIKRYGPPTEIVLELARDLKQSRAQKIRQNRQHAENQKRNEQLRTQASEILNISESRVSRADIQKLILWEELSFDVAERRCPYSGKQISARLALSDEVEIEHILPFSRTLDDSLNNKTLSTRQANRIKGSRTPIEAKQDFEHQGWSFAEILSRAELMPKAKRYRFAAKGYEQWLGDDKDFLARALNDTRYLSRIVKEYVGLICPTGTRVIPGQMTAMLRAKFGLNQVLCQSGEKNRNDHRHHAVDACVIGVTDQALLQRFARASASVRKAQLDRLVEDMPLPWPTYQDHVQRAVENIWVSHKPDHSHEGAMHKDTAYGLLGNGRVKVSKWIDGQRTQQVKTLNVIKVTDAKATERHGRLEDGSPKPFKGYNGDSNYCIEIVANERSKWVGEVISTFSAYQIVKAQGWKRLRHPTLSQSNQPLKMRLMLNDTLKLNIDEEQRVVRVATVKTSGEILLCDVHESNVDARNRDKQDSFKYVSKTAGSLQKAGARQVSISPIGELHYSSFRES